MPINSDPLDVRLPTLTTLNRLKTPWIGLVPQTITVIVL